MHYNLIQICDVISVASICENCSISYLLSDIHGLYVATVYPESFDSLSPMDKYCYKILLCECSIRVFYSPDMCILTITVILLNVLLESISYI